MLDGADFYKSLDKASDRVGRHERIFFDVRDEPWIPVSDLSGRVSDVSLREAFCAGDRYLGIAAADSLERHCLLRYLVALSYRAVEQFGSDWWQPIVAGKGFAEHLTDELINSIGGVHLLHPETPFLQDPHLPERVSDFGGGQNLYPYTKFQWHVPSRSSRVVRFEREASRFAGLTPAAATRLLVANWFGGPNGNVANSTDGTHARSSTPGGVAAGAGLLIDRHGPTLASTVVASMVRRAAPGGPFCWETEGLAHQNEFLWRYTANGSAFLYEDPGAGPFRVVLQSARPGASKDDWNDAMRGAKAADPHRVIATNDGEAKEMRRPEGLVAGRFVAAVHAQGVTLQPGVVTRSALLAPGLKSVVEVTGKAYGGTATSPVPEDFVAFRLQDALLDVAGQQRSILQELASSVWGEASTIESKLAKSVVDALAGPTKNSRNKDDKGFRSSIKKLAVQEWRRRSEPLVDHSTQQILTGASLDDIATPAWHGDVKRACRDVFDSTTERFASDPVRAIWTERARTAFEKFLNKEFP